MSRAGFYELLTGHFADGRRLEDVPEHEHLAQSVADHLGRLLNSRQGALRAAPGYGLPDTNLVGANQPAACEQLRAAIAQAIQRYEPRVTHIHVSVDVSASADFVHRFHITCRLRHTHALVEFEGAVRDDGRLQLGLRAPDANTWQAPGD